MSKHKIEIKNGKIIDTELGLTDHGFSCWIRIRYDKILVQGFGGYIMDGKFGTEFIKRVLNTVGVRYWEQLEGKCVRIKIEYEKIEEIGHLTENKWFNPIELSEYKERM